MKSESNNNSNRSSFTNSNPDYDRYKTAQAGRMTMPDGSMADVPGNSNHETLSETTSRKSGKGIIREGFMVRYGRRKYGRSFIHKRYFVLEPTLLAYYKKKPLENEIPIKSLNLDASCRVEDKGMEHHHGHAVYVLSIHNKKDKSNHITMASFSLNEANSWKEAIERVIEQYPHFQAINGNNHPAQNEINRNAYHQRTSSYDGDAKSLMIQEKEKVLSIDQAKTGDLNSEAELDSFYPTVPETAPMKHWRLVRCQNGLRIFEDFSDDTVGAPRAMKAVGVVDAKCEDIFSLIMGMDETRNEWDSTFHSGFMVEEVNGHTAVLYHRLQLDWCSWLVWPRDLCYQRYWRRIENGTFVVLFRSREHQNCPPQPGCVRAHIESGGFKIIPLKPRPGIGTPRARVEHQIQIDFQGWGIRYLQFYQHHCVMQMLNSVAGLREWFAQSEDAHLVPLFNRVMKMDTQLSNVKREKKKAPIQPVNQIGYPEGQGEDDESEDEDDATPNQEQPLKKENPVTPSVPSTADGKMVDPIDLSAFPSVVACGDHVKGRNSWSVPNGNNFRVRSRQFSYDRSKVPAGEPLMQLVAVDWFKHSERMDHLAQRKGCAAQVAAEKGLFTLLFNLQVPGSTHYSMVLYFVSRSIPPSSLLQRFIDGDDGFRNNRLKLIPSVPKGSWIVRQSVGTTPCILGKAVDCNYFRGQKYLEVDVDIGSSTVAYGVLGLVFGVIASLVVDMAFLVQGNSYEELPEKLIGTVRISRLELSRAVSPYAEKEKLP